MESLTIGQLAQRAGVGVETVRFYEREGLVSEPPRWPSGYRDYPLETVARIVFIRRAKKLGFTLKEVNELLELRMRPRRSCAQVKQNADDKIADIDGKIAALRRMRWRVIDLGLRAWEPIGYGTFACVRSVLRASPLSRYESYEECSTVRGLWTPRWTPESAGPTQCSLE